MSQGLQHEMHPDADQLNAFAEGALPAHAREETLAHLAVCAHCREVLNLSMPPMEDVAQPERVAVRRPWFSGWNLAWPVAALAGLILVTVYLRMRTVAEREAVGVQRADVMPQPRVPASAPPAPPAEGKMAEDRAATSTRARVAARVEAPTVRAPRTEEADERSSALMAKNRMKLPVVGRSVAGPLGLPRGMMAPKQRYAQSSQVILGSASEAVIVAPSAGAAAGSGVGVADGSAQGMAGRTLLEPTANGAALAPQPAKKAAAQAELTQERPGGVSETVSVQAAAVGVGTSDAAVAGAIQPGYLATLRPLPSGLPATSVASSKRQMVAIDLHSNVFFSKNGGKHWKAVAAQWQGRAVKVELAAAGVEFELTTDQAVVWVSTDGRSWRQK